MAIKENLYTTYHDVPEMEELVEEEEVVISQREGMAVHKGHTDEVDVMEVEGTEVGVSVTDVAFLAGKQGKAVMDDMYGDDLEYAGEKSYSEVYYDAAIQTCRGDNGEESYEKNTEEAHSSKLKSTISMEDVVAEINVKDKSFYSYADYVASSDEERIQIVGINGSI